MRDYLDDLEPERTPPGPVSRAPVLGPSRLRRSRVFRQVSNCGSGAAGRSSGSRQVGVGSGSPPSHLPCREFLLQLEIVSLNINVIISLSFSFCCCLFVEFVFTVCCCVYLRHLGKCHSETKGNQSFSYFHFHSYL